MASHSARRQLANCPIQTLPDDVLDNLVSIILQNAALSADAILASLGRRIHISAVRVLYSHLKMLDDDRYWDAQCSNRNNLLQTLLHFPERYGSAVQRIDIRDAAFFCHSKTFSNINAAISSDESTYSPIRSVHLDGLLRTTPNLLEFYWVSSSCPPDGICEMLATRNSRLQTFKLTPTPTRLNSGCRPKWDALSLQLLASVPLTTLHLFWLSQSGSCSLSILLSNLKETSQLEDVSLDLVWLDDSLCKHLAEAGKRIQTLSIGTTGTKLSDCGLIALFDGCERMRNFKLSRAQGRLTTALWSKIGSLPQNLVSFEIDTAVTGIHSWSTEHLSSICQLDLSNLTFLSIIRSSPTPALEQGVLEWNYNIDSVALLRKIPVEMVKAIREARHLVDLCCDWWTWGSDDLRGVFETCSRLKSVKIAFEGVFQKFLNLSAVFALLPLLEHLQVYTSTDSDPSATTVNTYEKNQVNQVITPAPTPPSKMIELPNMSLSDHPAFHIPTDPSLPPLRDIKRFAKKCPRLATLVWYGLKPRGTWRITRTCQGSKSSTAVQVEFHPPAITHSEASKILYIQRLKEISEDCDFFESHLRQGHEWSTPKALEVSNQREKHLTTHIRGQSLPLERIDTAQPKQRTISKTEDEISPVLVRPSHRKSRSSGNFVPLSPPTSASSLTSIESYDTFRSNSSNAEVPASPVSDKAHRGRGRGRGRGERGRARGGPALHRDQFNQTPTPQNPRGLRRGHGHRGNDSSRGSDQSNRTSRGTRTNRRRGKATVGNEEIERP